MRTVRAVWVAAAVGLLASSQGCNCNDSSDGSGRPCTDESECADGQMCVEGRCAEECPDCPDSGEDMECVTDVDGDGYGEGCRLGPDCDDNDHRQTGTENCDDGFDNDCDGNIDETARSACGCVESCVGTPIGPGTGSPFEPGPGNSDGVSVDDDGNIILDSRVVSQHIIWIADTLDGSVLKVDTRTFEELARYRTGPAAAVGDYFMGNDPSRSSVNSMNDVYIGNRQNRGDTPGSGSVIKISALGSECPDTNDDGMQMTSTAPDEVLPWGLDDCVLWRTELPDGDTDRIRAVAAQDLIGPDLEIIPYVWIGDWHDSGTSWVYKLDGKTGDVILRTESPVRPYGFALDGRGNLWIAGRNNEALGRLDTNRCVDEASCDVEICDADGDECIKQAIPTPDGNPYGITVDFEQRVWIAAHGDGGALRYDPSAAAGSRWTYVSAPNMHGIAADGKGFVYGAARDAHAVIRFLADDPTQFVQIDTGSADPKGMAVDAEGKIWSINQSAGNATVITPGDSINDNPLQENIAPSLGNPYTYSDMTGIQLRLATNPRGYYRHVYEGCPQGAETVWEALWWDAEVPTGTQLVWRVRLASTREMLGAAPWIVIGMVPPDAPPIDLHAKLQEADVESQHFLEVEVALIANRESTDEVVSPLVRRIDIGRLCPPILQ